MDKDTMTFEVAWEVVNKGAAASLPPRHALCPLIVVEWSGCGIFGLSPLILVKLNAHPPPGHPALSVGGIYTVIKTKTAQTVEECGENYCLIGPYSESTAKLQFEEQDLPYDEHPFLADSIVAMRERGIGVHFGRWLIDGAPKVRFWLCINPSLPSSSFPALSGGSFRGALRV